MTPAEVKALPLDALPALAADVRRQIVETVAARGGHLASSLGAVELVLALLRVFEPSVDRIVWDVGHQAYAWKILTGRGTRFGTLRQLDGLSGFPNPEESPCDAFVGGHAGAALSVAEGLAAARDLKGGAEHVVAVVGDAALANGMALEALEEAHAGRRLILVVNDNGPDDGLVRRRLSATAFDCRGPFDGHDVAVLEAALTRASEAAGPVAVLVRTVKGRGFAPAEVDPTAWHGVGPFDVDHPSADASDGTWSEAVGAALVRFARADRRVCALTAAMREGTGLVPFAQAFPDRFFDVGIREEHLVTFAAGLAQAGLRPVVAVYSTFLQRAVDQVMHDVCLLKLPVVFVVDRAGCVGHDGRTHQGLFDIPMLRCLPGLTVCQPSDAADLESLLECAFASGGPWVVRVPRGLAPVGSPDGVRLGAGVARVLSGETAGVQLWALGDQVPKARAVARLLAERGVAAGVVDARFAKPFDAARLARQRAAGACVVSLENGSVAGGFGEALGADLRYGWPDVFVGHGAVEELEARHGFTAESIAAQVLDHLSARGVEATRLMENGQHTRISE